MRGKHTLKIHSFWSFNDKVMYKLAVHASFIGMCITT